MKKMMYCRDRHSNLLCLIENEAISEMTWHEDGIYIYITRQYREYEALESARAINIKCDWTTTEYLEDNVIRYLQTHGTKVILCDNTILDSMPDREYIGF